MNDLNNECSTCLYSAYFRFGEWRQLGAVSQWNDILNWVNIWLTAGNLPLRCRKPPLLLYPLFLASETYEIRVNASTTVKDLGGISIHVMAEKLATSEGFTCLLVVSCVLKSKYSLANKWFVVQYITGCRSVVSEYNTMTRASRSWYIHFTTDLQPVIYWATNHC